MTENPAVESSLLTEDELVGWGERIGREAEVPAVVCLRGDLGVGKTTLARAIARGAGVQGHIPSPTFNLLFRYPAARGKEVVHLDLYRLRAPDEVWELGWSELPGERDLVLIEWPERAESLLPSARWEIEIFETDEPERRRVTVGSIGIGDHLPRPRATEFR